MRNATCGEYQLLSERRYLAAKFVRLYYPPPGERHGIFLYSLFMVKCAGNFECSCRTRNFGWIGFLIDLSSQLSQFARRADSMHSSFNPCMMAH
jgi:hypothetical protein